MTRTLATRVGRRPRRALAVLAALAAVAIAWWWNRPPLPVVAWWSSGVSTGPSAYMVPSLTAGFTRDGRTLLVTGEGGRLFAWDFGTDVPREVDLPGGVRTVVSSPDGRLLAVDTVADVDPKPTATLVVLDAADFREVFRFGPVDGGISQVARFSADGRTLHALANEYFPDRSPVSREVRSWDVATCTRQSVVPFPEPGPDGSGPYLAGALSPDGRTLAGWSMTSPSTAVSLCSTPDFEPRALPMPEGWEPCFPRIPIFDATGRVVAAGWQDGRVVAWDVPSRAIRRVYEGHSRWVESSVLTVSADGRRIASEGNYMHMPPPWETLAAKVSPRFERDRGEAVVWDTATGKVLAKLPKEYGPVLSPDGRSLATYRLDGRVTVWALPDR